MHKLLRIICSILLTLALLYFAAIIYSYPHFRQVQLDKTAVPAIKAQRLTIDDAAGTNLPPQPNSAQIDATVAGIDANDNGIRDDVELAIFAEYPTSSATSTQVRAAELQYTKELQLEFTSVFDSPTLVAVMQQEGRGYMCVPNKPETDFVEALVFNTDQRKTFREDLNRKYMTSFGLDSSGFCDLSL